MRKLMLTMVVLLGLIAPTLAQAPLAPGPPRAAVLFVQGDGTLDTAAQQTWETLALNALGPSAGLTFEASTAIFSSPTMSPADRTALTAYPDALIASSRATDVLNTQYLILVRISGEKEKHLAADVIDVTHDERYPLEPVASTHNDQLMSKLADAVHKKLTRMTQRGSSTLMGNTESRMYHLANADHTDKSKLIPLKDERSARELGYKPCPICFPEENKGLKAEADEGQLASLMTEVMRLEYPIGHIQDHDKLEAVAHQLCTANQIMDDPLSFKWINTDDLFSISFTGGEVYMSQGLQKILETPDEMAAVEAHELAHVERNHFLQYFREAYEQYGPASIVRFERPSSFGDFLIRLNRRLISKGFPLWMEEEADGYAVQYMARAGYDPSVYAQTLRKIQEAAEAHHFKKSVWTRIHPLPPERLTRLADLPAELKEVATLSQTVGKFDPGAAAAMQAHAVALAPTLPAAHLFATALQANEGTSPIRTVRGEPETRN